MEEPDNYNSEGDGDQRPIVELEKLDGQSEIRVCTTADKSSQTPWIQVPRNRIFPSTEDYISDDIAVSDDVASLEERVALQDHDYIRRSNIVRNPSKPLTLNEHPILWNGTFILLECFLRAHVKIKVIRGDPGSVEKMRISLANHPLIRVRKTADVDSICVNEHYENMKNPILWRGTLTILEYSFKVDIEAIGGDLCFIETLRILLEKHPQLGIWKRDHFGETCFNKYYENMGYPTLWSGALLQSVCRANVNIKIISGAPLVIDLLKIRLANRSQIRVRKTVAIDENCFNKHYENPIVQGKYVTTLAFQTENNNHRWCFRDINEIQNYLVTYRKVGFVLFKDPSQPQFCYVILLFPKTEYGIQCLLKINPNLRPLLRARSFLMVIVAQQRTSTATSIKTEPVHEFRPR